MSNSPTKTGSNWTQDTHVHGGQGWVWRDGNDNEQYTVQEIKGPGMPLYRLFAHFRPDDGAPILLKYRRQLKKPEDMFKRARQFHDNLKKFGEGGAGLIINHREWLRIGAHNLHEGPRGGY